MSVIKGNRDENPLPLAYLNCIMIKLIPTEIINLIYPFYHDVDSDIKRLVNFFDIFQTIPYEPDIPCKNKATLYGIVNNCGCDYCDRMLNSRLLRVRHA